MPRRTRPALVAVTLTLALAPSLAHADRAPNPAQIEEVRPPAPPDPAKADAPPPNPMDPLAPPTGTESKIEVKSAEKPGTKADAKPAAKAESGGMCRVGASGGGWELLVLAGLGVRLRRRRACAVW